MSAEKEFKNPNPENTSNVYAELMVENAAGLLGKIPAGQKAEIIETVRKKIGHNRFDAAATILEFTGRIQPILDPKQKEAAINRMNQEYYTGK